MNSWEAENQHSYVKCNDEHNDGQISRLNGFNSILCFLRRLKIAKKQVFRFLIFLSTTFFLIFSLSDSIFSALSDGGNIKNVTPPELEIFKKNVPSALIGRKKNFF